MANAVKATVDKSHFPALMGRDVPCTPSPDLEHVLVGVRP